MMPTRTIPKLIVENRVYFKEILELHITFTILVHRHAAMLGARQNFRAIL